jgi:hypothetical protein
MMVLSMYVTVAEKGALGVFVGDGVMEGVTKDKRVAVGSSVKVGKRVGVSVTFWLMGVFVHVGRSWICVIVGVGGIEGSFPGARGLMAEFGIKKIATKYAATQRVKIRVNILSTSQIARREPLLGAGESS